jgi:hypothetical protein
MRVPLRSLFLALSAVLIFLGLGASRAQQQKAEPAGASGPNPKIIPVVVLKPGESKELVMSTWCRVGATRGGGLWLRAMDDGSSPPEAGDPGRQPKTLKRAGVTVTVPGFGEAERHAGLALYAPLKERGINAFVVKVTADKATKPGLLNFHLADTTCSGGCETDFRVLVVSP